MMQSSHISGAASNGARRRIRQDTFICRRAYDEEMSFTELHSHKRIEISIVVDGSGVHRILGQALPCCAGDIYIVNSDVPHGYFAAEDGEEPTVERLLFEPGDWFEGEIAQPSSPHFCHGVFSESPMVAYAMLTQRVLSKIRSLFSEIAIEQLERKNDWHSAVRAHLSLALITLGRYINKAIKNVPSADPVAWNTVSAVMAAVKEGYGDSGITLDSLAKSFYTNKAHLSRIFKQLTGEHFSDYLRKVRLSEAAKLLAETDLTVDVVLKSCGMRDAASFYKSFGEHTGMTPKQYRKANKKGDKVMNILNEISENVQKGKSKVVKELVQSAIDSGLSAKEILSEGLLAGMSVVGEKFKNNEVYVPEVLVAARAMNMGTQLLKPHLAAGGVQATGKVCIGTVQGDLHDIGKNLVKMMMEGKGLEVIDLGTDVTPEAFIQAAIENDCRVICCSALLTTTMGVMKDVVRAAEAAGIRDKVKIMIGGAPVTEDFCRQIGADCYTVDAASAADAAAAFCKA